LEKAGSVNGEAPVWRAKQWLIGANHVGKEIWRGRAEGIAIFSKALTAIEIQTETKTYSSWISTRKRSGSVRFRGTLIKQAKTSSLDQMGEYTRSLTAAEYKIDEIISGDWKEPTIFVLHWAVIDRKHLPITTRKLGTKVILTVARCCDNPQLDSCRRDDDLDGILDAEPFYCELED
jgi:hypothetical protein